MASLKDKIKSSILNAVNKLDQDKQRSGFQVINQNTRDYFKPQTGGLATAGRNFLNTQVNIPKSFQQPAQSLIRGTANVNRMVQPQNYQILPGTRAQDVKTYAQNRYIQPIRDIPKNLVTTFNPNAPLLTKERGLAALGVAGGVASFLPDPFQDIAMPGYDFFKGYTASGKRGGDIVSNFKAGVQSATMEKPVGLGDVISTDPTIANAANLAELPLLIGMTGKLNKGVNARIGARKNIDSINSALNDTSPSFLTQARSVLDKLDPKFLKNKEVRDISKKNPALFMDVVKNRLLDWKEVAEKTDFELPIGFQAKPRGGTRAILEAEATKVGKTEQLGKQLEKLVRTTTKEDGSLIDPKLGQQLQTSQKLYTKTGLNQPLDNIIQDARKQIGTAPTKTEVNVKQSFDNLYTQWVDRYNPFSKASKVAKTALEKQGARLRPEADPEVLVRRLTGAGGIADQRFKTELNPILKQVESSGIDKTDLDVYLANKRVTGFGKIGREVYGADPVKAEQVVNALEQKYPQIRQISEQFYTYQNKGFQEMVDAGFLSPDQARVIREQNPDYAPLYRVMDEVEDYLGLPTRKTMQGSQPIKKLKGSERQIESPVESIIGNTFTQRAAIEKNAVAKSLVKLQEIAPELGFEKVSKAGDDTITVWNNGLKEYWRVGDEIAQVAKGVNEENMNMVLKILQAPAALLRQGATGRNPEFMIPNIIRDQLDAGITSKYGYIPFVDYVSGFKSMLTNDQVYQKWAQSGAKIDLGELSGKKGIRQLFDEKKASKSLLSWLGEGLDFMGKISEQPTRVGLFKKAYKKTGNELLAMMESRDATVDFARMGSKMKVANSIIPFLNVGVQGFDKLIRSTKNNPAKVALNAAIYGATPAMAATIYNLASYPEEYAEIPQYEKDSNFVFVKGRNENGTVSYITIPKGNVIPVVANPVQNFLEYAFGNDRQSFFEMMLGTFSEALPVLSSGTTPKEVALKTIGSNLPQAIKPITENLINKSFFKYDPKKEQSKEIVPYYLQDKEPYKQSYDFTPQMYQKIGAIFNTSPLQVQNLLEGYLAGYAKIPAQLTEVLYKVSKGEKVSDNEKTIFRRFVKETYPTSGKPAQEKPKSPGLLDRLFNNKVEAAESDVYSYFDSEGDEKKIDLTKIRTMPESSNYEKIKKQEEAYKMVDNIIESGLKSEEKADAIKKLGIAKEDAETYLIASSSENAKTAYVTEKIDTYKDRTQMLRYLIEQRREVNGKRVLSNGVIDGLEDAGYISDAEAKQLKKLDYDGLSKTAKVKTTGRGKSAKIKKITVSDFKLPSLKTPSLKGDFSLQPARTQPAKISVGDTDKLFSQQVARARQASQQIAFDPRSVNL